MGLREEIKPYLDADGLVAYQPTYPGQVNASGNGLLLTSLYYLCLVLRNEATIHLDRADFHALLKRCSVEPGLLSRGPHHPDQQAMDDYLGVATACRALVLPGTTARILSYGRNCPVKLWGPLRLFYHYNNVAPGQLHHPDGRINWNAWLGRMPQLVAHLQLAAGERPWPLRRLWWALVIAYSAFARKSDHDAWLMSWLLIWVYQDRRNWGGWSLVGDAACWYWRKRFAYTWPEGMTGVLAQALGHGHPIVTYWPA